jgi:hypothetical protein
VTVAAEATFPAALADEDAVAPQFAPEPVPE